MENEQERVITADMIENDPVTKEIIKRVKEQNVDIRKENPIVLNVYQMVKTRYKLDKISSDVMIRLAEIQAKSFIEICRKTAKRINIKL